MFASGQLKEGEMYDVDFDHYLGFADRFTGTLIITGEISDVTSALTEIVDYFRDSLGYVVCNITKR